MGNYNRGHRAELRAKRVLQDQGFLVIRAAGSKGFADLVAVNAERVRFVQVKRTQDGRRSFTSEVEALAGVKVPVGCSLELWIWRDRQGFEQIQIW